MRSFGVALALSLVSLPASSQHEKEGEKSKNPAIGDPKAIEAGKKLFRDGCGACHGPEGEGGRGPNLRLQVFWHPLDDDTLFKAVKNGIPGGGMPPANLPDDQSWQVVAYVRSLTSPAIENAVPGDRTAGELVFSGKGGCANCHRVNGRGGLLGPDLSNVAATRSAAQIREAITEPDADGAPGYRAITVTLRGGKTVKGVARNRTNYSIQVQDAEGNLHLIRMSDVTAVTLSKGSPMPGDFAKRLTPEEIDNLVAYLGRLSVRPVEMAKK
jgi:putative heme-binding domain-containing protein